MPDEGSVFVEGVDTELEDDENSSEETTNEDAEVASESEKNANDDSQEDSEETHETDEKVLDKEGEKKLTDKGTKLDDNPLSAAHQELANARSRVKDYEALLRDPEKLTKYLEISGYKKETKPAEKAELPFKIDVSKLNTAEDLAEALNGLQTTFMDKVGKYEETISSLQKELTGISEGRKVEKITSTMQSDISKARSKFPELDPNSGEGVYNSELEQEIAALYRDLDFDEEYGGYRGKISIYQIAEKVMSAASKAQKRGSENAQTVIKDKKSGKIVTSSKQTTKGGDKATSPEFDIASRVRQALKK